MKLINLLTLPQKLFFEFTKLFFIVAATNIFTATWVAYAILDNGIVERYCEIRKTIDDPIAAIEKVFNDER